MTSRLTRAAWLPLLPGLLVVALLAVWTPDPDTEHRFSWRRGGAGEAVSTAEITVRAGVVRLSHALARPERDAVLRSEHVWVAVPVELSARGEQTLGTMSLRTRSGAEFFARTEGGYADPVPPGWTSLQTSLFLVPVDQLPGAELVVVPHGRDVFNHDTGVRIDLALPDAATVRDLAGRTPTLEVAPATQVVS